MQQGKRAASLRSPRGSVLRRLLLTVLALTVMAGLFAGAFLWFYWRHLDAVVVEKLAGRRWQLPSRIYSDVTLLYPGIDLEALGFAERLERLNYREAPAEVALRKGDFRRDANRIELFPHDFAYPGSTITGRHVRLHLQGKTLARIEDAATGEEIFSLQLEPEVITGLYDSVWEERRLVSLAEVPPLLVQAIITTEDQRYFQHHGVDFLGILRALLVNLREGEIVQGGSTLTQQLAKNFFLTDERTLRRKVRELLMAPVIEHRYTKEEILEAYLNEIYLGQNGLQGVFGVWEASQFYFGRPPQELSLGEIALLAGMIRAPNRYSPHSHPQAARTRRDTVLRLMREAGNIDDAQYAAAAAEPVRGATVDGRGNTAPYFTDFLQQELAHQYPHQVLVSEGLRIFTGLDMHLQRLAERAVKEGIAELERRYPRLKASAAEEALQACLIAIQPQTGEIRAMVGGRDYRTSQFNRAVQARRQPGSVFKPFVYLAAFEQTRSAAQPITAITMLDDEPFEWAFDNQVWRPENYKDEYLGRVSVRQALELSLNAATARLARDVGIAPILGLAQRMGIGGPLPPYPSVVLGALETSPLEVAQAYAVFANQGLRPVVRATKRVLDPGGRPIERFPLEVEQVASPEATYLVTHLMEGVLDRGTAASARSRGFKRPAAGKTGTTNDARDAWFAGFTPDLLTIVWVGFDQRKPLGLTGASAALPIWTEFMKAATAPTPPSPFVAPAGVALVSIDPLSGGLATAACPQSLEEAFLRGLEPTTPCPLHAPSYPPPAAGPPDRAPGHLLEAEVIG